MAASSSLMTHMHSKKRHHYSLKVNVVRHFAEIGEKCDPIRTLGEGNEKQVGISEVNFLKLKRSIFNDEYKAGITTAGPWSRSRLSGGSVRTHD